MSALLTWADDEAVEACGWCGHEHPREADCGCKPCPDCSGFHGPSGGQQ